MNFQQLKILQAIAKTGSFRAAAELVHLTQPAISHQLKNLEEELGESLVIRTRPRVVLSPAGETVLAAADRITQELEDLKYHFAPRQPHEISGVLRVAASTLGIVYLYGDLLQAFIERYPRVSMVVMATESGVDGTRQLQNGLVDVAFTPLPIELNHFESIALGETEHVVITARNHALGQKETVTVNELRQFPFIRYRPDAGSRIISDQVFASAGNYPTIFLESNDTEFIKRVVAMGVGCAIVPKFTVGPRDKNEQLSVLRMEGISLRQNYGLVFRSDVQSRALRLFISLCLEQHQDTSSLALEQTLTPLE